MNYHVNIRYKILGIFHNIYINTLKRILHVASLIMVLLYVNTLIPRQNRRQFPDDILKCILLNENIFVLFKISLKFLPKGPIHNIPAMVQIMAWYRPGDKPLSEPKIVSLLTHICLTICVLNCSEESKFCVWHRLMKSSTMTSQISSVSIVYSAFRSDADQRKHQSFASLAFMRGIHRWPVNSPHKGPVTGKMFPFDDVIMIIWQCGV